MMKVIFTSLLTIGLSSQSFADSKCDFAGLQVSLRNTANSLHSGNPVKYIDFANNAQFGYALREMEIAGVSSVKVQNAWAKAIHKLCGNKAKVISVRNFRTTQTLTGLMHDLKITD